jgi:hypothetical protein
VEWQLLGEWPRPRTLCSAGAIVKRSDVRSEVLFGVDVPFGR